MRSPFNDYLAKIPPDRKTRTLSIRKSFHGTVKNVEETMRYRMPTFEKNGNSVSMASQKHYLAVYFCSEEIIQPIKNKFPKLSTGKGCVRIRDNQEVPIKELAACFKKAINMKKYPPAKRS